MQGRMSMDQAKAIKQKRELAKELGTSLFFTFCLVLIAILEDVQAFAKAVEGKVSGAPSRKVDKALRKLKSSGSENEKEESNDDDEESDVAPKMQSVRLNCVLLYFLLTSKSRWMRGRVSWLSCRIKVTMNDSFLDSYLLCFFDSILSFI